MYNIDLDNRTVVWDHARVWVTIPVSYAEIKKLIKILRQRLQDGGENEVIEVHTTLVLCMKYNWWLSMNQVAAPVSFKDKSDLSLFKEVIKPAFCQARYFPLISPIIALGVESIMQPEFVFIDLIKRGHKPQMLPDLVVPWEDPDPTEEDLNEDF